MQRVLRAALSLSEAGEQCPGLLATHLHRQACEHQESSDTVTSAFRRTMEKGSSADSVPIFRNRRLLTASLTTTGNVHGDGGPTDHTGKKEEFEGVWPVVCSIHCVGNSQLFPQPLLPSELKCQPALEGHQEGCQGVRKHEWALLRLPRGAHSPKQH